MKIYKFYRPSLPIKPSIKAQEIFERDSSKLLDMGKYPIYHCFKEYDPISFAQKAEFCPSIKPINKEYTKSDLYKKYVMGATKLMAPTMKKVFGINYAKSIGAKFETLRYSHYYNKKIIVPITEDEAKKLRYARILMELRKGYFIPMINKLGCHYIFNQFLNLFDYAMAIDTIGEEKFQKIALFYHKTLAERDEAYIPRYKWLKANPEALSKLRAVFFENHDDLVFMIVKAICEIKQEQIFTPFASLVVVELHKDSTDQSYYIKVMFNNEKIKLKLCDTNKCGLKRFAKTLRKKGMFFSDQEFYSACYGKLNHNKRLKLS